MDVELFPREGTHWQQQHSRERIIIIFLLEVYAAEGSTTNPVLI